STEKAIELIPDSPEFVHFINEARFVTCIGRNVEHIKWLKPDGSQITDTKGRVHVEEKDGRLLLMFDKINNQDHGKWSCVADADDSVLKFFHMKVYVPISFEAYPNVQTAKEDQDATIKCKVKGVPEPKISWYFNGQQIVNGPKYKKLSDGLLIRKVWRNNSGEYTCKAFQISETISNVQEQTVRLNVQHKPYMKRIEQEIRFGYIKGYVNLTCEADAEPPAEFIWYRDGKKVFHNVHNGPHISILQVYIQSKDNLGEYKCRAKNSLGQKDHIIKLQEGTKPETPQTFFLRGVNSDTLDIDVGAKRDPKSTNLMDINGYRFELIPKQVFIANGNWQSAWIKDFSVEDGVTYLLNPLSHNTTYLVRVASRNLAGLSDWTETQEFTTLSNQPHKTSRSSKLKSTILFLFITFLLNEIN
ncbi:unnamed protein product, partial [Diamesa serratosioi]